MKMATFCAMLGVLAAVLLFSGAAIAQGTGGHGAMQGQVTDRYGNPIVGANVSLESGSPGDTTVWTTTNANGMYLFSSFDLSNSNIWRVRVEVTYPARPPYEARSIYINVYDGQLASNDVQFFNYPPSGRGNMYGVLTSGVGLGTPWYDGVVYLTSVDYPGITLFAVVNRLPNGEPAYYNFEKLPVGTYSVRAQHNSLTQTLYSETIAGVMVDEDKDIFLQIYVPFAPLTIVPYPQPTPNTVKGFITMEDGETPLVNVNVSVQRLVAASRYTQVGMAYTDLNGYYNVTDITVEGINSIFRVVMTYVLDNQTHGWTSPDFYFYNAHSYGDNANHVQTFDRSLDINLTGYVRFNSTPPNATVYVNNQPKGNAPLTISLPPGSYGYVLSLANHSNQSGSFTVTRGQTTELQVTMPVATAITTATNTAGPGGTGALFTIGIMLVVVIVVVALALLFMRLRGRSRWRPYSDYYQQPGDGYFPEGGSGGGYYAPNQLPPYDPYGGYQGQGYDRGHYGVEQYGQPGYGYPPRGFDGRGMPPQLPPPPHPEAYMGRAQRRSSYDIRESQPVHETGQGFTPQERDYVLRYIAQNPGGVSFVQMSRDLDIPMNVLTIITKELVISGLVEKEKGNYYPKMQGEQLDTSSVVVWRDEP